MNEKITTMQGKWEEATTKLQGFDSEIANVRAQLQSTDQELDVKWTNDEALLRNQSGQAEKIQTTLWEMQTTQSTLVDVMKKAPNYVIQDSDQDETSSVD